MPRIRAMGTYSPDVYFRTGSLLLAPHHPRLHIRRQLRQRHHRHRIAEGCAAKYICDNRRARCATGGQWTVPPRGYASGIGPSCKDAGLRESRDRLRARSGLCAVSPAYCCRGRFRNLLCPLVGVRITEADVAMYAYNHLCATSSSSC